MPSAVPIDDDEHPVLIGLAANPVLPREAAIRLIAHGVARPVVARHSTGLDAELCARILAYRDHAAVNPHIPEEVKAGLDLVLDADMTAAAETQRRRRLTHADPAVRERAAHVTAGTIPADLVTGLLDDRRTRCLVASHAPLTRQQFLELATDDDENVRSAVAHHPDFADAYELLAEDAEVTVRLSLMGRQDISDEQRARLWESIEHDAWVSGYIAGQTYADEAEMRWLRCAPASVLDEYLSSPYDFIRDVAVTGRNLSQETLERLVSEGERHVPILAAAYHGDRLPGEILAGLVSDERTRWTWLGPWVAAHPNFPRPEFTRQRQEELAASITTTRRIGAARDAVDNPDLVVRLLTDPDPAVVETAAASPALPVTVMDRLLTAARL